MKHIKFRLVFILYESFATKSISIIFLVQIHLRSLNRLYMFLILNRQQQDHCPQFLPIRIDHQKSTTSKKNIILTHTFYIYYLQNARFQFNDLYNPFINDEDDDSNVDLFGEETEEEKKVAEECAAAVKASGKKKECKLVFILSL